MQLTRYQVGEFLALLTALCWTVSSLAFESASRRAGSLPVNLLRMLVAFAGLSIVGLLFSIHPWLAYLFVAASLVYYVLLRAPAFLAAMLVLTALALVVVHALGGLVLPVSAAIFVVAWVFQFVGHKIEGKKPSFFEDIQYLWVGPLFVLSKLFLRLGIRW